MSKNETIEDMLKQYLLAQSAERNSPMTLKYYESNVTKFIWYCTKQHDPPVTLIRDVDAGHVRGFSDYIANTHEGRYGSIHPRAQKPLNEAGIAAVLRAVRAFLKWCRLELDLKNDPLHNTKMPKRKNAWLVTVFSNQELAVIFAEIGKQKQPFLQQRNKTITLLALDSGMRASELMSLKMDSKILDDSAIQITGKRDKIRYAPLGYYVRNELLRYLRQRDEIIKQTGSRTDMLWIQLDGSPCGYDTMKNVYRILRKKTGIKHLHMHTFRHTFATNSHKLGISSALLQAMLGHADFSTTAAYYLNINADDVRESTKYSVGDAYQQTLPPRQARSVRPSDTPQKQRGRPSNTSIPAIDVLMAEVAQEGFRAVGRKYGVSDTAIRKKIEAHLEQGGQS